METYRIVPVRIGYLRGYDRSGFTWGRNAGVKMDVPCIVFAVMNEERTVIVDAGPCLHAADYHPLYCCPQEEETGEALRRQGIDPASIDTVVLSHLHWDHVGGVSAFPNARFILQEAEIRAAVAPMATQRGMYDLGHHPLWLDIFDRCEFIRGDQPVAPGIDCVFLPGHSAGMQGVLVQTEQGRVLLASDSVPLVENWNGDAALRHIPNTIHTDVEAYFRSFEVMERVADFVIPGHDPLVFDKAHHPVLELPVERHA